MKNNKLNILLITPPNKGIFKNPERNPIISRKVTDFTPLGLLYIASYIKQHTPVR